MKHRAVSHISSKRFLLRDTCRSRLKHVHLKQDRTVNVTYSKGREGFLEFADFASILGFALINLLLNIYKFHALQSRQQISEARTCLHIKTHKDITILHEPTPEMKNVMYIIDELNSC